MEPAKTASEPSASRHPLGAWYPTAVRVAWVSGILLAVACGLLIDNHRRREPWNPVDTAEYRELRAALVKAPADDALKGRLRELDRRLRQDHFERLSFSARGAYPLLGAALLFVISMKWVLACRRPLPDPMAAGGPEPPARSPRPSVAALSAVGAVLLGSSIALGSCQGESLTREGLEARAKAAAEPGGGPEPRPDGAPGPGPEPAPTGAPAAFPTREEIAKEWPRFRGPTGSGVSAFDDVPDSFDVASGKGIVWKTPIPLPGHGSPVVWGERIFLTGADETRREVICIEASTGKVAWREPVAAGGQDEPPEILDATGYAAPTPATDGRRVHAIFASGDMAAFDVAGKRLWERKFGPLETHYGYGTSLVLHEKLVIVGLDQATEDDGKSAFLGLDALTGETVWEAKRPVAASWATPIIIPGPKGEQLITSANPLVIAHEPATGKEIWRADAMAGDVAPSPIFAGGLVFAVNIDAELLAIRPDGEGDITETHIAWRGEDGLPDITSPVSDGALLFVVTSPGKVTCYDVPTGEVVWEEKLKLPANASPSIVGKRLHIWGKKGTLVAAEAGRAWKELARSELGEEVNASPAFAPGRMYVRGAAHLWAIGK